MTAAPTSPEVPADQRERDLAALERVANSADALYRAASSYRSAIARRDPKMGDLERQRVVVLAERLEQRLQQQQVVQLLARTPGFITPSDGDK